MPWAASDKSIISMIWTTTGRRFAIRSMRSPPEIENTLRRGATQAVTFHSRALHIGIIFLLASFARDTRVDLTQSWGRATFRSGINTGLGSGDSRI